MQAWCPKADASQLLPVPAAPVMMIGVPSCQGTGTWQLHPAGIFSYRSFLWRREKEPKRHHPPKALPQGRDATAPPVALLNRYARPIKGPAYFLFFGAIYTMLKHQGASRTAGTRMAGDAWQGTGTWHEPRSSVLPSLVLTGKRLGEDQLFSGAFGVFRCISAIFRAFCLVVLRFFVYLQAYGLVSKQERCYLH